MSVYWVSLEVESIWEGGSQLKHSLWTAFSTNLNYPHIHPTLLHIFLHHLPINLPILNHVYYHLQAHLHHIVLHVNQHQLYNVQQNRNYQHLEIHLYLLLGCSPLGHGRIRVIEGKGKYRFCNNFLNLITRYFSSESSYCSDEADPPTPPFDYSFIMLKKVLKIFHEFTY